MSELVSAAFVTEFHWDVDIGMVKEFVQPGKFGVIIPDPKRPQDASIVVNASEVTDTLIKFRCPFCIERASRAVGKHLTHSCENRQGNRRLGYRGSHETDCTPKNVQILVRLENGEERRVRVTNFELYVTESTRGGQMPSRFLLFAEERKQLTPLDVLADSLVEDE